MKRLRIGNDILIKWALSHATGGDYSIEGQTTALYLCNQFGKNPVTDYTVKDNTVTWTFLGKDQRHCGSYTLMLCINEGDADMVTVDVCGAFELMPYSCGTGGTDATGITTETVEVESSVILGGISPAEFEEINAKVKDWEKRNLSVLLDSLVIFTPEYGGASNMDAKAFLFVINNYSLIIGQPRPCLFKREISDDFSFGSIVFNKSADGNYLRLDITANGLGKLDMSKDEILWSPDFYAQNNLAYLYDVRGGYLMTLGIGGGRPDYIQVLEQRISKCEKALEQI